MIPFWIASNVYDARQAFKLFQLNATLVACGLQKKSELPIELLHNENLTSIDSFNRHSFLFGDFLSFLFCNVHMHGHGPDP